MKLEHSDLLSLLDEQDIIILTETWKRNNDLKTINNNINFDEYSVCRQAVKAAKRGSGGISVFIKKYLSKFISYIKSDAEGIIWFKLSKFLIKQDRDIFLCGVYISPKTSTRHLLHDNDLYDKLYNDVLMYSEQGYCMICGDMNSRSGCLQDYIDYDDNGDINNVLYDRTCEPTRIQPRVSEDKIVNEYGKRLIDLCIANDLIIVNGRTEGDPTGSLTMYNHNGSSVVDYVICSRKILDSLDLKVGDINPLSDHCIIYTRLSLSTSQTTQLYPDITHMDSVYTTHIPYKWKSDAMEAFILNIASKHIQLQAFQKSLDSTCITKHIVNNTVTNLSHVLREASKTCANHMKPHRNTSINSNMPWHNEQCKSLRKDFTTARNKLKKYKTKDTHYASQKARNTYNRCCKVQKAKHDARMTALHIRQKHSNPRLFWRSIKPHVHLECPVTLTQFYTHFSDISNSNNSKLTSTPTPNYTHTVEQLDRSITKTPIYTGTETDTHAHCIPGRVAGRNDLSYIVNSGKTHCK